ncbi:hypothetical protein PYCCODRAFT_1463356 [Trametes coccinea BRFM310]|uniref:Uncharacterized protein n=1 Tax=Trametes coccinea (strain BRFM310) TaxID=1353009 RepID=A0A1Y2J3Y2_TRAC3|nr:hypothetical protein PYCCODRAFT_1463356 [Trametes coccinea BRFM310]
MNTDVPRTFSEVDGDRRNPGHAHTGSRLTAMTTYGDLLPTYQRLADVVSSTGLVDLQSNAAFPESVRSFITDTIEGRISLIMNLASESPDSAEEVLPAEALGSLLCSALLWYIDEQCLNVGDDAYVIFTSKDEVSRSLTALLVDN